jgi:hypothetical protein
MRNLISGDLLSAASLLTTALSLLYATWYGEIKDARNTVIPPHLEDRDREYGAIRTALWTRSLPLLIAASFLAVALAPTAFDIISGTWDALTSSSAKRKYDPVQACFLGVFIVTVALVSLTASGTYQLWLKKRECQRSPNPRSETNSLVSGHGFRKNG